MAQGKLFHKQINQIIHKSLMQIQSRNSCNRVLVGQIIWEKICKPAVLYGAEILLCTWKELDELEQIQVYLGRCLLGALDKTPWERLLGEL